MMSAMVTFEISLPEDVKAIVEVRARHAGYSNLGDYVSALLRAGIGTPVDPQTEAELIRGLDSPGKLVTRADWDEKVRRFEERMRTTDRV